jgi:hypothetical protein
VGAISTHYPHVIRGPLLYVHVVTAKMMVVVVVVVVVGIVFSFVTLLSSRGELSVMPAAAGL